MTLEEQLVLCEHDVHCSGFGWAHDAQVTPAQRKQLGIPRHEVSVKKAKRAMRSHRKALRDAALRQLRTP